MKSTGSANHSKTLSSARYGDAHRSNDRESLFRSNTSPALPLSGICPQITRSKALAATARQSYTFRYLSERTRYRSKRDRCSISLFRRGCPKAAKHHRSRIPSGRRERKNNHRRCDCNGTVTTKSCRLRQKRRNALRYHIGIYQIHTWQRSGCRNLLACPHGRRR